MITWSTFDTWMVATGAMCALACAVIGNFLVLRRMSLMGDAISHALLPGIVAAFMFTGSRATWPIFIGAAIAGIATAWLAELLRGRAKVDEGAAMGVVFTTMFAIGLILLRQVEGVDLDADCVLNGLLEPRMLDTMLLFGQRVPRVFVTLGVVFLVNLVVVIGLYKELKISSFDPQLATTLGINARLMHYLLMSLTAITTVAAFEAVGPILVIAMLIVPPATAYLLTDRLPVMIGLSLIVAVIAAAVGHVGAITLPAAFGFEGATTTSGMMATAAGALFLVAMIASPRHGAIAKAVRRVSLEGRILREDVLAILYRNAERSQVADRAAVRSQCDVSELQLRRAIRQLQRRDLLTYAGGSMELTDAGRAEATKLIRAHRLWEQYLQDQADVPPDHLHATAERLEHVTDAAMRERLAQQASSMTKDPHGREIPDEK